MEVEIESLAVAWAMEKFNHFLYASHFILETDQKPLESILSKSLNQATPRLQRILIRTFPYNFTAHYIPGVTNQLADCLSRLGEQKDTIKLLKLHVYQITQQLSVYTNSDCPHKLMMNLLYGNTPLCKGGSSQSNKYPQFYNPSGHLERN